MQAGRWMTNTDTSFLNLRAINFPSCPWTFTLFSIVTNEILLAASTRGTWAMILCSCQDLMRVSIIARHFKWIFSKQIIAFSKSFSFCLRKEQLRHSEGAESIFDRLPPLPYSGLLENVFFHLFYYQAFLWTVRFLPIILALWGHPGNTRHFWMCVGSLALLYLLALVRVISCPTTESWYLISFSEHCRWSWKPGGWRDFLGRTSLPG